MWSGQQANGRPAAGGWFKGTCSSCGIKLVAYENVYDEAGKIPQRDNDVQPELHWQLDDG
jgi:hypothetical protein